MEARGLTKLHRLQQAQLLTRAIAGRTQLIISNTPAAATAVLSAATATNKLMAAAAATAGRGFGGSMIGGGLGAGKKARQATLLTPKVQTLRSLVALLPTVMPLLQHGPGPGDSPGSPEDSEGGSDDGRGYGSLEQALGFGPGPPRNGGGGGGDQRGGFAARRVRQGARCRPWGQPSGR